MELGYCVCVFMRIYHAYTYAYINLIYKNSKEQIVPQEYTLEGEFYVAQRQHSLAALPKYYHVTNFCTAMVKKLTAHL